MLTETDFVDMGTLFWEWVRKSLAPQNGANPDRSRPRFAAS
jgi:hypothetical protein